MDPNLSHSALSQKKNGPKPNAYVEGYEKKSLHFLWFGIGLAVSFSSFFTSLETKYIVL